MLYFPQTRVEISTERAVALGHQITAEGAALVADLTGGVFGVKMSDGVAGQKFVGVSVNQVTSLSAVPKIESLVVGTGNQIILGAPPIPGTLRVVRAGDGQVYTAAGTPAAAAYTVDSVNTRALDFVVGDLGKTFNVTYQYAPTLVQAMALQGNTLPGGPAGQYLGQVGVITRGDVFTNLFDTSADWSSAVGVTLGANGLFEPTSDPTAVVIGTQIIALPTSGSAYLGLHINAVA